MTKKDFDIQDDDFRVIGRVQTVQTVQDPKKPWGRYIIIGILIVAAIVLVIALAGNNIEPAASTQQIGNEDVVFEPMAETKVPEPLQDAVKPLGDYSDTTFKKPYTEHLRDTINDIPLDIYIPHNATPELVLGVPSLHDKSIVMTTQAAVEMLTEPQHILLPVL